MCREGCNCCASSKHSSCFQKIHRFLGVGGVSPALPYIDVPFHIPVPFHVSVYRSTNRCASPHVDLSTRHFTYRCPFHTSMCRSTYRCAVSHIDVPFHTSMCRSTYRYTVPRNDTPAPFYISMCGFKYRDAVLRIDEWFHVSTRRNRIPMRRSTYRYTVPPIIWYRCDVPASGPSTRGSRARPDHLYIISTLGQALLCTHPSREAPRIPKPSGSFFRAPNTSECVERICFFFQETISCG